MKKRNIYLIFTFLLFPLVAIVLWFLFVKNETTNNNIKSIPKNCNDYLIINTDKISTEISSYFLKNPSLLLKIYENTSSFKAEFEDVDFILNEPISIFRDETNEIIIACFSLNNPEEIDASKFDLKKIKISDKIMFLNENKNTLYFRNENKNQLKVFFYKKEINLKSIDDKFISNYLKDDTSNYNLDALNHYKSNSSSVIFKGNNNILNDLGISSLKGDINFNQNEISLSITGKNNDKFIFKDSDSLITIDNNWMSFSANFNKANINFPFILNQKVENVWDGKFSISLDKLKSTSGLMSLNKITDLLKVFDFSILLGSSKENLIDSLDTRYGKLEYISDQTGLILANKKELALNYEKADYFNLKVDLEKLLNQEVKDFSWSSIKMIIKKLNLEKIKINCFKDANNSFKLRGNIYSSDSTKHILLSPFIY
jgi:hypothetical protein